MPIFKPNVILIRTKPQLTQAFFGRWRTSVII